MTCLALASAPAFDPVPSRMADDPQRACLLRARRGDAKARHELVRDHMRLVGSVARAHVRAGIELDDLVSEGVLGLLEAIDRFDLDRDNRFATYATYWVRERIGRYARSQRGMVAAPETRSARKVLRGQARARRSLTGSLGREPTRAELAASLGVDEAEVASFEAVWKGMDHHLDGYEADDPRAALACVAPSPEEAFGAAESAARERERVLAALAALGERERIILRQRYMQDEETSLTDIGLELGVSRERVRQLQQAAKTKLARSLAA